MEFQCPECGCEYSIEDMSEIPECPDCGFSSEVCDHPIADRDEREIYDAGEGKYVKETICSKCGVPLY